MTLFGITITVHHYFHCVPPPAPPTGATSLTFALPRPFPLRPLEVTRMKLDVGQSKTVVLVAKDANGNLARLDQQDGPPQWTTSNPAVATIAPTSDGLSATVSGVAPGTTQLGVRGDADLDAGETRFLDSPPFDVVVSEIEAATIEIAEAP